jgi:hypothetical protein
MTGTCPGLHAVLESSALGWAFVDYLLCGVPVGGFGLPCRLSAVPPDHVQHYRGEHSRSVRSSDPSKSNCTRAAGRMPTAQLSSLMIGAFLTPLRMVVHCPKPERGSGRVAIRYRMLAFNAVDKWPRRGCAPTRCLATSAKIGSANWFLLDCGVPRLCVVHFPHVLAESDAAAFTLASRRSEPCSQRSANVSRPNPAVAAQWCTVRTAGCRRRPSC